MSLQLVFEDSPSDCESSVYIDRQPEWQRETLRQFATELLKNQKIQHRDARKINNERWSLWVRNENGEAINHVCYLTRADTPILSDFARHLLDPKSPSPEARPSQRLMIVNSQSAALSSGKADPYLDPEYFASLMDSVQREIFLKVINDLRNHQRPQGVTTNADGSFSIRIHRPNLGYGIHIECKAKWVH